MKFTWTIDNFTRLNTKKHYSEVFVIGSYKWRILVFPKGNNVDHLSMYLDVTDSSTLPYGWSRYAQFSLAVVNQVHSKLVRFVILSFKAKGFLSDGTCDFSYQCHVALSNNY
ncbi:ubiquitin C-terminal hydrolase 12-like [Castanea sativa]|uniref:ubiquitin C-terminal hydrolase 12-like n=1 Tax=Castanea sativa TaxID=21020 RepID=UPI003F64BAC0